MPIDFGFLAEPILEFVLEKEKQVERPAKLPANPREVLQAKLMHLSQHGSPNEVFLQYLSPLEYVDMDEIVRLQSLYSRILHHEDPARYPAVAFRIEPIGQNSPVQRGIDWLLAELGQMNKKGLEIAYQSMSIDRNTSNHLDMLKTKYRKPYWQCILCGKPFYLENPFAKLDLRKFLCHSGNCVLQKMPAAKHKYDPYKHLNCCYGQWGIMKHQLNVAIDKIEGDHRRTPTLLESKITRVFMNFVARRFEEGASKQYRVLTESDFKQYRRDTEEEQSLQAMLERLPS